MTYVSYNRGYKSGGFNGQLPSDPAFLPERVDAYEVGALERRVFSEPGRRSLLGLAPLASLGEESPFHPELASIREELPGASSREIASAWELRTYMADLLLRDSDVMSMRHSLELRVPLVDRPLIEWLWRQPAGRCWPRGPASTATSAGSWRRTS